MTRDELNLCIENGGFDECIGVSEARQVKDLGQIADDICARGGKRFALVAGASSAGKTTTAMRLCTQLKVNGCKALHLSTDDYFVGDARNPRDENGNLDYEHVECVDIARLAADVEGLLAGRPAMERKFDFVRHEGFDSGRYLQLPPNGVIVLEGIHALNPRLTEGVDEACKYRVFIEPRPGRGWSPDGELTSSDARLLRRIVRDNHFRKTSPAATFRMWANVCAGEKKWIDPFRPLADAEFNSFLEYEPAVLRLYAAGPMARAQRELGDWPDIVRLQRLLEPVYPVWADHVPGVSILRETIGGSFLNY